jgi:hypothetical protein
MCDVTRPLVLEPLQRRVDGAHGVRASAALADLALHGGAVRVVAEARDGEQDRRLEGGRCGGRHIGHIVEHIIGAQECEPGPRSVRERSEIGRRSVRERSHPV